MSTSPIQHNVKEISIKKISLVSWQKSSKILHMERKETRMICMVKRKQAKTTANGSRFSITVPRNEQSYQKIQKPQR